MSKASHEDTRALWNQVVQTGREDLATRPDVIIKNIRDNI
jgi:hypothetical protein